MNKYQREDYELADRILNLSANVVEAAEWVANFRDELESGYAENVEFVHRQLQLVRQREMQLSIELARALSELRRLRDESNFETADTIPVPPMQVSDTEVEHV